MPIRFFSDGIDFSLKNQRRKIQWINSIAKLENRMVSDLNFIFTTDNKLSALNTHYLNHFTLTDIITFDYSESNFISGDIYISLHRVKENAKKFDTSLNDELNRVIIHGVLHLCGYRDKTKTDKFSMRKKEDDCLSLLRSFT